MAQITFTSYSAIALFALALYFYSRRRGNRSSLPLPPGPKKLPFIGNIMDMPSASQWLMFHKWSKEFDSDIIYLDAAGTSIIILDSAEAATDLLEKRSSIYSGRPRMPMVKELMGWDFNFSFMDYGDQWRQHRRVMHHSFQQSATHLFRPHMLKSTYGLLRTLLDEPGIDVIKPIRHLAGETIISIAYGIEVKPKDDPHLAVAERAAHVLEGAAVPGAFVVDAIPALKYVPDWMPFAGFKRKAKEWRQDVWTLINAPFETAKTNISKGDVTPSFVSHSLENMDAAGDLQRQEYDIKCIAGTMYIGGADTTVAAMATCILGLLSNPVALKKAQTEVDSIVGPGRLPHFDDEADLPYIMAITKETLRWGSVTPIGVPHLLSVDDEYKGYLLPAGSIVIGNSWAMLHDENVYPDSFEFNPDRFMKDGKLNPAVKDPDYAFGFGRRICPGRYMALAEIWIVIASIIATLDITKPLDENGEVIEPSYEFSSGLLCAPLPFKCSIKPRSAHAEALIRATVCEQYY